MSDDEHDRLLIDDPNDVSGSEGYGGADPTSNSVPSQENIPAMEGSSISKLIPPGSSDPHRVPTPLGQSNTNGILTVDSSINTNDADLSREEGELDDEDMDISVTDSTTTLDANNGVAPSDSKTIPTLSGSSSNVNGLPKSIASRPNSVTEASDKKRSSSPSKRSEYVPAKKSKSTPTVAPILKKPNSEVTTKDRGTCVQSRAVQSEGDESLFDMAPGSSFVLQMTVVCRIDSTNTMYVSSKWKDKELSGILTEGDPPGFVGYAKKRAQLNGAVPAQSGAAQDGAEKTSAGQGTPSKKRIGRGGQTGDVKRKTPARNVVDGGADDGDDELDVGTMESRPTSGGSGGCISLVEVPSKKSMHTCNVGSCQHRYESGKELEYHKSNCHKPKNAIYESSCSQTEISAFRRACAQTDTDGLGDRLTEFQKDSIHQLMKAGLSGNIKPEKVEEEDRTINNKSNGAFSDISDDGAPQLVKEEPQQSLLVPVSGEVSKPLIAVPTAVTATPSVVTLTGTVKPVASAVAGSAKLVPDPSSVPVPAAVSANLHSFQPVASGSSSVPSVNVYDSVIAPPTNLNLPQVSASPRTVSGPPTGGGVFIPHGFVNQMGMQMGPYMPAFASPISSRSSPGRDPKINQLRGDGEGTSTSVTSAPKSSPVTSMAAPAFSQQRQPGPFMSAPGMMPANALNQSQIHPHQQLYNQQQHQMLQQMIMQSALRGQFPGVGGTSAQDQQQVMQAMHAAAIFQNGQFPNINMFPK